MREIDFLMIYEHKVRELENLCLLKYELEKRGHSVEIIHIEDSEALNAAKPVVHAKVVILMACYRNETLEWHTKDYVKFDKVIDMQWENIVYPKDENAPNVFKNYSGIGKEVVRVSWGEANKRRLLDAAHMDERNVKLIGHVGMDFLRDELRGYYLSKEELFGEYDIPMDKKILLFASPFYADNLSEEYIQDMCNRFGEDWRTYYAFMMKSEQTILEWMECLCKKREDIFVIYRPHPGHIGKKMSSVEKKCDNFKIISDKSIKQWILVSDIVYTGNSSTIVEAFFAKKMCYLLFPYEVTEGFELHLINGGKRITTYEEFLKTVDAKNAEFPIDRERINDIYLIDEEEPGYVKFANMAEEVLNSPEYNLSAEQLKSYRKKQPLLIRMQKRLQGFKPGYDIYLRMLGNENYQSRWLRKQREIRKKHNELIESTKIEDTSREEIDAIVQRIKQCKEKINGEML